MSNCYLCGTSPAIHELILKKSFTAHSVAKCPESKHLCDRCEFSINLRANYWNNAKGKYSLLYARNWSWLYQGDNLLSPVLGGEQNGFPIVKNLATRIEIRDWLLNPPDPPFTIAIAESGQKHILFLAQPGHSKTLFPVQFETDSLIVKKPEFDNLLFAFEGLMGLGATKMEIVTGEYKSGFLLQAIADPRFEEWESTMERIRGQRLLDLLSHVGQKNESILPEPKPTIEPIKGEKPSSVGQLSLF